MKKLLLLSVLLLFVSFSFAQKTKIIKESKVPSAVLYSFEKICPKAKDIVWEKIQDAEYDVEYEKPGSKVLYLTKFLPDGTWISTEHEVKASQVPKHVWTKWIKEPYKNWDIEYILKVDVPKNNKVSTTYYHFVVKKGSIVKGINISVDDEFITEVVDMFKL